MIYPPNASRVAAAKQAAGSWVHVQPFDGLGRGFAQNEEEKAAIPTWVWWGGGGLAVGLLGGWLIFSGMKRKK